LAHSFIHHKFSLKTLSFLATPIDLIIGEALPYSRHGVALFAGSMFEERIIKHSARATS